MSASFSSSRGQRAALKSALSAAMVCPGNCTSGVKSARCKDRGPGGPAATMPEETIASATSRRSDPLMLQWNAFQVDLQAPRPGGSRGGHACVTIICPKLTEHRLVYSVGGGASRGGTEQPAVPVRTRPLAGFARHRYPAPALFAWRRWPPGQRRGAARGRGPTSKEHISSFSAARGDLALSRV